MHGPTKEPDVRGPREQGGEARDPHVRGEANYLGRHAQEFP